MVLSTFILYLLAAVLAFYNASVQRGLGSIIVGCLALFFAFETQGWFLTLWSSSAATWPAHSLHEILVIAARGVSTPTTLAELMIVAVGRLLALLGFFYSAFFFWRFRAWLTEQVKIMPTARLCFLVLWVVAAIVALTFKVLAVPSFDPLVGISSVLAALGAFGYTVNLFIDLIRERSSARLPSAPLT